MADVFVEVAKHKKDLDTLLRENYRRRFYFSDMFYKLFPSTGNFDSNMVTWLIAIAKHYQCEDASIQIYAKTLIKLDSISWDSEDGRILNFYACLVKIFNNYPNYRESRPCFDNIFAFMSAFKLKDTKVVILGLDPSPVKESSGFAFHDSVCNSTRNIYDFLNYELRLLDQFVNSSVQVAIPRVELAHAQRDCDLSGWIEQGVLLMNAMLTRKEPTWHHLTDAVLREIDEICDGVVFIATGQENMPDLHTLIDLRKNLFLRVNHPVMDICSGVIWTFRAKEKFLWEYQLPFLNANYFLYQKEKSLIDWNSLNECDEESAQTRFPVYEQLFQEISRKTDVQLYRSSTPGFIGFPELRIEIRNGMNFFTNGNRSTAYATAIDFQKRRHHHRGEECPYIFHFLHNAPGLKNIKGKLEELKETPGGVRSLRETWRGKSLYKYASERNKADIDIQEWKQLIDCDADEMRTPVTRTNTDSVQ